MTTRSEPDVIDYVGFRDLEPDGVIEQPFYERYNSRLEMPIAFSVAVLMPVALVFFMVLATYLALGRDKTPVAIMHLDGDDDAGLGSPGSGGVAEPLALGAAPAATDLDRLPKLADISQVKDEMRSDIRVDANAEPDISDTTAAALGTLHEELRQKIAGQKRGSGKPGTGGDEGRGTGVGGTGVDSTRARALRWIIKFDTRTGRDYVDQIAGLGGVIFHQMPGDNRRVMIYRNLKQSYTGRVATDADLTEISDWLQFEDIRQTSIEAISEALNIGSPPPVIFVKFPKELEVKLDKLERQFQNRDPKDIKETVYKVVRRGGEYDLFVVNQILR
jgi:hypothetical protein